MLKPPWPCLLKSGDSLNRELVGCWLMNENTGSICHDISEFKNHGTISNLSWGKGNFGSNVDFDGINGNIEISSADSMQNLAEMSISFYFNSGNNSANYRYLIDSSYWSGPGFVFYIGQNTSVLSAFLKTSAGSKGRTLYASANEYNHVVMIWNGSSISYFLNGIKGVSQDLAGTLSNNSYSFWIGQRFNGIFKYDGILDNLRFYNRAISDREAVRLYEEPFAGLIGKID